MSSQMSPSIISSSNNTTAAVANASSTGSTITTGNSLDVHASAAQDELDGFLLEALRSLKDRLFVLKIEHTILLFIADPEYSNHTQKQNSSLLISLAFF